MSDIGFSSYNAAIAINTSLTAAIDLGYGRLFAIQIPAAWTAADLTFRASADGVTYANLYDDTGAEVVVKAAASEYVVISAPAKWIGIRYIQIRSGTASLPVNQAAARTLNVVTAA